MCNDCYFNDEEYYYGDVPYDYDYDYYPEDSYPVAPTPKVVYLTAEQILADDISKAYADYEARVLVEELVMAEFALSKMERFVDLVDLSIASTPIVPPYKPKYDYDGPSEFMNKHDFPTKKDMPSY